MTWHVERLDACDSTQDVALARARDGGPNGTIIVAGRMEDGRGQHGRAWHAPEGGLYLSIVLRDVDQPRLLTLALGNAVADVLEVAGAEPRLKWVNDVLVDGKKIAGILVEAESTGDAFEFMVAGIGINVAGSTRDWPSPLSAQAVTLEDVLGAEVCTPDLEGFLFGAIETWLGRLASEPAEVVEAWRKRDFLLGKRIGIDPEGDFCAKVLGVADGIDGEGRLRVRTDEGVETFENGSVFLQE